PPSWPPPPAPSISSSRPCRRIATIPATSRRWPASPCRRRLGSILVSSTTATRRETVDASTPPESWSPASVSPPSAAGAEAIPRGSAAFSRATGGPGRIFLTTFRPPAGSAHLPRSGRYSQGTPAEVIRAMKDFKIWMNGKLVSQTEAVLPVNSAAVFYASNVFEGIRAYWNEEDGELYAFRLAEHFARFRESMKM